MPGEQAEYAPGIEIKAPFTPTYAKILTPEAIAFVAFLHRGFTRRRDELLQARSSRQAEFDAGKLPDFLPETAHIRADDSWRINPYPADLTDRRVEIAGPVDRESVIKALNSGANTFVADFEDATAPTWVNLIEGQIILFDAARQDISLAVDGGEYRLNATTATLMMRPRGWHLDEKHVLIDSKPCAGSLFDFGLYFFHNAKALMERNSGPYLCLPKIESHLEAQLWNDIFCLAQDELGIARGTVKATVMIETLAAAFEMDEILYEIREHSSGLGADLRGYVFSILKMLRSRADFCLANRARVDTTAPYLRACCLLLVKTCHQRGAFAMGGMAAQIPINSDPAANEIAMASVRADKEREAADGFDGTWIAHPGLVELVRAEFDRVMPAPNQISRRRNDVNIGARDLLDFGPDGPITEAGLAMNIQVAVQYLGAWLAGNGCVPILNLIEGAAAAEISRVQVWHWLHSPEGMLTDGRKIDAALLDAMLVQEIPKIRAALGEIGWKSGRYEEAAQMFSQLCLDDRFVEFLTLVAYERID